CGACHTPIAWNPAVNFDHTQARGSCSTCHNGTMAQGKGPTHIVTDLECDACHTTLSWAGAMFTHVGVTSGCATCHDGVHADGLAPRLPPSDPPAEPPAPHDARQLLALLRHLHSPVMHRLPELPWLEHRTLRRPPPRQHDHERRVARQSLPRGQPRLQRLGL